MGGRGAAGGGGGNSTPNFGNTQPAEDFLQIDPNLLNLSDTGLGLDNLIFGDSSATTNIASDTTNTTRNTETNTDTARETVVVENTPGQEGDTVETTYENIGTDNNNAAAENSTAANTSDDFNDDFFEDNSDFDRDFFGANLDASDGSVSNVSGLSRAELEAQGLLEASRLGSSDIARSGSLAIQYESLTSAEVRTLQDFRSSAVSGGLSPFQGLNEQPDTKNGSDEQGAGFFKKITNFFSALLGFGPPQR
ncbi:MAG: hypothetical protein JKX80_01770 [Candidatus Pacebacteria bacterium]|nr:hypothetical protein [Candidatus Paceibacterota bacterium]